MIERPNAGDQITWVALRFWLGGQGQRNREEYGEGATIFFFGGGGGGGKALPLSSAPGKKPPCYTD